MGDGGGVGGGGGAGLQASTSQAASSLQKFSLFEKWQKIPSAVHISF